MGAIQEDHDNRAVVDPPVDSADTGEPETEPIADEAAGATPDVELEPEPSDHGIDEYPLIGSQYTSEGEEYQLEIYEQYSDDGERMMAIRDDHLHDDADGAFPVVIEDNDTEVSELDDDEVIKQRIQSIRIQQDTGQPAKQTTMVVRKSSVSMTRLKRPVSQIRPLVAKMTINGLDVVIMFDTGSTSDAVSPEFARVANMKIHLLDVPMGIQLGWVVTTNLIITTRHCLDSNCVYCHGKYENTFH
jgi:hypothetical protein